MLAILLTSLLMPTPAPVTQDACDAYVGRVVKPSTFAAATAKFRNVPAKGEFETTAAFEAKRTAILGDATTPLVILKSPEDRKYFAYDADAQKLRIAPYAFDNTRFDSFSAFFSLGLHDTLDVGTDFNREVVISRTDTPTGSYVATNGFGARFPVTRVSRSTTAIFEGKQEFGVYSLFVDSGDYIGEVSMTADEARKLKPALQMAFVVVPKPPYFVTGRHSLGDITIRNPYEITESFSVLIADIQCGLLLDSGGKVLGSYPTR